MSAIQRWRKKPDGSRVQDKTYTIVFDWQGKQKWIQTDCTDKAEAERQERDIVRELKAGRIPDILSKLRKRADATLTNIVDEYVAAGCPDHRLQPRADGAFDSEKRNLDTAMQWWSGKDPKAITAADCDAYWKWRKTKITKGTGDRTTELELQSLANALSWAVRAAKLDRNPLEKRPRYRDPKKIRHARDCMPGCADEWHVIAGQMFNDPRSEVNGWAYLLAGATGLRAEEMRLLRTDATRVGLLYQPGFIDEKYLHVQRCKNGCNPRIKLDDPERPWIRPLLEMILAWKTERYPDSPWLLPGRDGAQLGEGTITKCLTMTVDENHLNLRDPAGQLVHRTCHGARAYYVTTRLAQGHDPEEVAREVGQRSGDDLVRDVYGIDPDEFVAEHYQGLAHIFRWLPGPAVPPAWSHTTAADEPLGPPVVEPANNILRLPIAV